MSDKLRNVILTCFLILICPFSTCCESVKEVNEQQMVNSLIMGFIEHTAFSTLPDVLLGTQENISPKQTDLNMTPEIYFIYSSITEEVYYNYDKIKKSVFKKYGLDKERIVEQYDDSKEMFALLFSSKNHPINHVSNEDLKTLYFECGQNILDSGKKLYDYSRTGSSKDKKEFLKTSEKLEDSLLILYQGMLGEHGSDSDILQTVKTHNQDYRKAFVSDIRNLLLYLNEGSVVLAHTYKLNDSRSLSDWTKIKDHLLQKEIQVKKIVFLTSIEWANQEHVKEKLVEIVKNQQYVQNRVLADILYGHLTSKYGTEDWLVIVYDALDEIDEGGKVSLVGIHHHVFQVGGKIVLAFRQSKFITNVMEYIDFKKQDKPFYSFDGIGPICADGNCDLKASEFLDLLRTYNFYGQYSIIVLPPKTNSHYYHSYKCPGFHIFQCSLKKNPYSLFFVKSYRFLSEPDQQNLFETPKTRSKSEL